MGRRSKSSLLEDLIDIVSLQPWWVGVCVAIFGYLVLNGLAPLLRGDEIFSTVLTLFTTPGKYLVVFVGLSGAALSIFRRQRRADLVSRVVSAKCNQPLQGFSWREFEMLVGEAFRLKGFEVQELGGSGPDGGVDLSMTKGGERFLVQCKQWKAYTVGVGVVRELYGVVASQGATGGFVVTSGRFTAEAHKFASGLNIQLIEGQELSKMIESAKGMKPSTPAPTLTAPSCPICASHMVLRTAKKGKSVGDEFWGCPGYPKCRGVRKLR